MTNPNRIPVLEKAVDILEYIGSHPGPVTRTELQQALGIPQATCYRVIATLLEKQWLEAFSGNRYDLTWHLCKLTGKKRFDPEAYKKFQPLLNRLAGQLRFPVKLSIRDGEEFINVCSAQATWDVSLFSEPGTRCPVDCSSSVGTVFFAEAGGKGSDAESRKRIEDYRKNGRSFNPGTLDPGSRFHVDTLSFPVRRGDSLLAVLSVLSIPGMLARADWTVIGMEVHRTIDRALKLF